MGFVVAIRIVILANLQAWTISLEVVFSAVETLDVLRDWAIILPLSIKFVRRGFVPVYRRCWFLGILVAMATGCLAA